MEAALSDINSSLPNFTGCPVMVIDNAEHALPEDGRCALCDFLFEMNDRHCLKVIFMSDNHGKLAKFSHVDRFKFTIETKQPYRYTAQDYLDYS